MHFDLRTTRNNSKGQRKGITLAEELSFVSNIHSCQAAHSHLAF